MWHRLDIRFGMELEDRLYTNLAKEGVVPMKVGDIKEGPRIMELWRDLPHDMMSLMHHIIGVSRLLSMRRDDHADIHTSSSTRLDNDQGGDPSTTPPPPPSPHPYEKALPIITSLISP
jgi:hypothetical protein